MRIRIALASGALTIAAVAAVLAFAVRDGSGVPATTDQDIEQRLERRPLRLPSLPADGRCPFANATALPGVPTEAALGPGKQTKRGLRRLRRGPVYVAFQGVPRIVDLSPSAEILWISRPSYDGPVLIRGGRLVRRERLRLEGKRELRLATGPWDDGPVKVWDRIARPRAGWRMVVSSIRARASSCYAFQVDGEDFSYRLAFETVIRD